eukprot:7699058-Pyramimonas_sp.AAC.1
MVRASGAKVHERHLGGVTEGDTYPDTLRLELRPKVHDLEHPVEARTAVLAPAAVGVRRGPQHIEDDEAVELD